MVHRRLLLSLLNASACGRRLVWVGDLILGLNWLWFLLRLDRLGRCLGVLRALVLKLVYLGSHHRPLGWSARAIATIVIVFIAVEM